MLTSVEAAGLEISGVSVGGIYTCLSVPQLDLLLDVGIAPRSFVGPKNLLISHGHADHVGALSSLLGHRGLARLPAPRIFLPAEIAEDVREAMAALNRSQRRQTELDIVPLSPGDERPLYADLHLRCFRTLHSVPSLGFQVFRRVQKLRSEFHGLPAPEIRERRRAGDDLFFLEERSELSYATDTLIDVLDQNPELYKSRVLILESTFLDDTKPREEARRKSHVHLDEIIERAERFECEALVLMHFSQLHSPRDVRRIIKARCSPELFKRIVLFAPERGPWPG